MDFSKNNESMGGINMAKKLTMPKLGLTMKQGKIVKWYKKENDQVRAGDKLYSVETDKLTNDIEATDDGILRKIIVADGGVVPCLAPVAILADADEDISHLLKEVDSVNVVEEKTKSIEPVFEAKKDDNKSRGNIRISPVAKRLAIENNIDFVDIKGTGPGGRIVLEDVEKFIEEKKNVKITPAAAKIAKELDLDYSSIHKEDRIRKDDIYRLDKERTLNAMAEPVDERVPMSTMRKIIAERMGYSRQVAPTVNFDIRIDTTNLKILREQLKPLANITYTDFIVKIVSKLLLEFPLINGTVDGEEIILRNYVNMGVAVALVDGLLVPVVKYSHIKGLKEISDEIKDLSYRAKNNQLTSDEITGGTFTISNIGMFGIESFTPIINQPESAILGVNAIIDTPVVENGNIVIKPLMNLSLTADHRSIDGAVAAQFLAKLKEHLENPAFLLI